MPLLALADKVPNADAIALSPTVGWWMFAAALSLAAIFIANADRWRRFWLTTDDPRGIAVFRIVFTFFVISNINGMWEFFEFLYTDEGIFTADVARQVFAAHQFEGFGDGFGPTDPWGFFDMAALARFLAGPKYSLLYFWDSPAFFWGHMVAFWIAAVSFLVGFRTRTSGVLTWLLMNSILNRNHLGWEGTEMVYRCFLAYLILARSGHAYSIDNWLRCRRLRRQGRLSERGTLGQGAGAPPSEDAPQGLEAVYRQIPSWPRKLIMLQLCTIYFTTGALKTGSVWMSGDSLYYALNLDHFYRVPPQYLASIAGTTVFRAMTWAVKIGQMAFPLVMVGIVTRWLARENFAPLRGPRRWAQRLGFVGLVLSSAAILFVVWPVHITPRISRLWFCSGWISLWGAIWWLWHRLGTAPFVVRRVFGLRLKEPLTIDRIFVSKWILGRRVLLVWHIAFHGHIFTLMNVGQFQTGMLSATFAFLEGREIATMLRDIGHRLASWGVPFIPRSVARGEAILPAEDPRLPHHHRDAVQLPVGALALGALGAAAGVLGMVYLPEHVDGRWIWTLTLVGLAAFFWTRARAHRGEMLSLDDPRTGRPRSPWAYGPTMRFIVSSLIVWHLGAVMVWLMPDKDSLAAFRPKARGVVATWLTTTATEQGWGMFAPNPPRTNVFMKVLVTDMNGEIWDLRSDVYAKEHKPIPWIWNTRLRKMNRRIIGGESGPDSWYQKWYARYECRHWALDHNGEAPRKVELVKIWYRIPSPEETRKLGYYIPEQRLERVGAETVEYVETCRSTVMGQLPNEIRARHGLPPLPDETPYRPWLKHKRSKWERTQN